MSEYSVCDETPGADEPYERGGGSRVHAYFGHSCAFRPGLTPAGWWAFRSNTRRPYRGRFAGTALSGGSADSRRYAGPVHEWSAEVTVDRDLAYRLIAGQFEGTLALCAESVTSQAVPDAFVATFRP